MFINSDSNSDSEQCTESKLGRVHNVHTLNSDRALGAVSWCALAPFRGPPLTMPQHALAVPQAVSRTVPHAMSQAPLVTIQSLYRNTSPCRVHCTPCRARKAPCRTRTASCRERTLQYRSAIARCITIQKVTPSHDTKFVSRLTPSGEASCARAPFSPLARVSHRSPSA